jgi:hypothetical protein
MATIVDAFAGAVGHHAGEEFSAAEQCARSVPKESAAHAEEQLAIAMQHHRAGRLQIAEQILFRDSAISSGSRWTMTHTGTSSSFSQ